MRYFNLVFDTPVKQSYTYSIDAKGEAAVGKRAAAPFGRRELTGFIIGESDTSGFDPSKIKSLRRVVDKEPLFSEEEIELSSWIASYYLCSQGEALSAMIPSGRRPSNYSSFSADDIDNAAILSLSPEQSAALKAITDSSFSEAFQKNSGGSEKTFASARSGSGQIFEARGSSGGGGSKNGDEAKKRQAGAPPFYLYGITGSGKTEVFLRAAEHFLNMGKSVIYLVPEIALTHQTADVIGKRFGALAATLHSLMSGSERLAEWMKIRRGEVRIVVGPRSAVFSPVRDLGLIIIDEEHDSSFKSGNTPRYHARQIAMRRSVLSGAALVMGSATPSAEAWHLMLQGKIKRLDLTRRLSGGSTPNVSIVSLEHTDGVLTRELKEAIKQTHLEGRQSILFLNRRGFAYFYHCKDCGYELLCKNCSVSLTWHKAKGRAVCHYCGYEASPPSVCPKCGSLEAGFVGFGTEMVEEELKRNFPDLKVRRIDADSVQKKGSLEEVLAFFRAGAIDVLLGTQMVAKGLNFPGVRLVGVIFADTGLHLPDFRAAERTFSLIVQVAGRAGRFFPDGKVIVQTLRPNDDVIKRAAALDIEGFFEAELINRREQGFPPYSRIIRIVARSREAGRADAAIHLIYKSALSLLPQDADILGPAECPLSIISQNHRRHIIMRGADMGALHNAARRALLSYEKEKDAKVYIEADVDPVSLL